MATGLCTDSSGFTRYDQMLKNLDRITDQLASIGPHFYGRIVIRVRDGMAVMITEERDTRLDEGPDPVEEEDR